MGIEKRNVISKLVNEFVVGNNEVNENDTFYQQAVIKRSCIYLSLCYLFKLIVFIMIFIEYIEWHNATNNYSVYSHYHGFCLCLLYLLPFLNFTRSIFPYIAGYCN